MRTELQFLVDLLLNERLAKSTQQKVKERIAEVEESMRLGLQAYATPPRQYQVAAAVPQPPPPHLANQPESTRRLLEKYPDLAPKATPTDQAEHTPPSPAPQPQPPPQEPPVSNSIAVTQALAARQALMAEATMPLEQRAKIRKSGVKTHGQV